MKLLLTGDSIIARKEGLQELYLNVDLRKRLPALEIINTAVSGINSGAFFARLNELVFQQERCDNIVLLLGTNDLARHKQVPLTQFGQNMALIVSSIICLYYPQHIFLVSPPAVDEQKQTSRTNNLVAAYSGQVQQIASVYHCHFVNLAQAMLTHGDLTNLCCGSLNDGLHFGAEGYNLLADLLARGLLKSS
ncbi:GDSL-type esterase/lipase family protein [Lactobacillus sp. ESL0791]|uniref:GDSL-type esterase/lipase family protein n=1 Tax=Lactobacillus sp. ESL0791 TaxID=2983234 RepID=UPI0023F6ACF9|nr:GDSL-type esterase/lipase family protein [Lactobacillus sp. ESL0791]MDF7639688.1 GDSL-type esterase/lipase family protein [Lactobacillus sp. ESL0791]